MEYRPDKIIVHHSAASSPQPQFAAINEWHKARNFPLSSLGFHVGYHIVIEPDGTEKRARVDTERDCDALGHNFDSLSVCLVGNFDKTDPTPEQVAALGARLSAWTAQWRIGASAIFPHRKFAKKSCYGSRLPDNWAAIVYLEYLIAELRKMLAALQKPV